MHRTLDVAGYFQQLHHLRLQPGSSGADDGGRISRWHGSRTLQQPLHGQVTAGGHYVTHCLLGGVLYLQELLKALRVAFSALCLGQQHLQSGYVAPGSCQVQGGATVLLLRSQAGAVVQRPTQEVDMPGRGSQDDRRDPIMPRLLIREG